MNNIKDLRETTIMKYLDQFSGMVARSLVIKVQNPDESDERTEQDYGDGDLREKVNNQE